MASFVSILGDDAESAAAAAQAFAKEHNFTNVAICSADDLPNGPESLNISPDADITVMSYVGLAVKANHAFDEGIDEDGLQEVVDGTALILADDND